MDFRLINQTITGTFTLLALIKDRMSRDHLTPAEWGVILAQGLTPILRLHGITIEVLTSPLGDLLEQDVRRALRASSLAFDTRIVNDEAQ